MLHSLERKVAETEGRINVPDLVEGTEESARAHEVAINCRKMRDEIYELCQEIENQYRQVRHRSAAAELRQLRRCYHELDHGVERLTRRRIRVLDEIREFDPLGAEAIERADSTFLPVCQSKWVHGSENPICRATPDRTKRVSGDIERYDRRRTSPR